MKENIKMENGMDMENYMIAFLEINYYIKETLKMEKNMEKEQNIIALVLQNMKENL